MREGAVKLLVIHRMQEGYTINRKGDAYPLHPSARQTHFCSFDPEYLSVDGAKYMFPDHTETIEQGGTLVLTYDYVKRAYHDKRPRTIILRKLRAIAKKVLFYAVWVLIACKLVGVL